MVGLVPSTSNCLQRDLHADEAAFFPDILLQHAELPRVVAVVCSKSPPDCRLNDDNFGDGISHPRRSTVKWNLAPSPVTGG